MSVSRRVSAKRLRTFLGSCALVLLVLNCGSQHRMTPQPSRVDEAVVAMATSPNAVVQLFARLDTAGFFTCYGCDAVADSIHDMLVCWSPRDDCATDEPAWDVALVASGYSVRVDSQATSHASFSVLYRLLGQVSGGVVSVSVDSLEWRPTLRLSDMGWQITGVESQRPPVLSVGSAMRLARTAGDSARLAQLIP